MEVSRQLKKQIILELGLLILFVGVTIYGIVAINDNTSNAIKSQDGMLMVIDDSKFKGIEVLSDGEALLNDGVTLTVTNNNKSTKKYKIVVFPNIHNEDILQYIRLSTDSINTKNLVDLDRYNGGYIVLEFQLDPGYTKIHLIKTWYDLEIGDNYNKNTELEYQLVVEDI